MGYNLVVNDIIDAIIELLEDDYTGGISASLKIVCKGLEYINLIPYRRLEKYFLGVKQVEKDLGGACKLSSRLSDNNKDAKEKVERICLMVSKIDTENKIDYLINCTRCFLMNLINREDFFRIFHAICNTLPEDLEYLRKNALSNDPFTENFNVLGLASNNLMMQTDYDFNKDVEDQEYVVTKLGRMVDRYALSCGDDEREKLYHDREANSRALY